MTGAAFQRSVMAWAAAVNVGVLLWTYPEGWWWLQVVCLAWLVLLQVFTERSRRRLRSVAKQWRWDLAASTRDPISALAQMRYMDSLTPQQRAELYAWFANPPQHPVEWDDLPPVVAGMLRVVADPPREGER